MTMVKLMETSWFKRTVTTLRPSLSDNHLESLMQDKKLKHNMSCNGVNAFDIISMSSGLDLSGLFEGGVNKRKEKRYTTTSMELDGAMERVREIGERLGYRVEKGKSGVVGFFSLNGSKEDLGTDAAHLAIREMDLDEKTKFPRGFRRSKSQRLRDSSVTAKNQHQNTAQTMGQKVLLFRPEELESGIRTKPWMEREPVARYSMAKESITVTAPNLKKTGTSRAAAGGVIRELCSRCRNTSYSWLVTAINAK
ncbi:hypothetical protein GOBAR_DD33114 [Gossypium barbadense]|nr:hypothetical protein GOBAR_DD33114 [Gossypium barbadense]